MNQFHQQETDGAPLVSWQPCERLAPHIRKSVPQTGVSISSKAMGHFFLSRVVGELPGEKSRYDAIRKNQREE